MLCDLAAERSVIAGLFNYGSEVFFDIADYIQVSTFTDNIHQVIFDSVRHLIETKKFESIDQASLLSAINELDHAWIFDKTSNIDYISNISLTPINKANVVSWAVKIRKLEIARLLQEQLKKANSTLNKLTGDEAIDQIIGIAENSVLDFTELLQHNSSHDPSSISDGVDEFIENAEHNQSELIGISTGYPYYDHAIGGGCRFKTVSLLGARTGVGKSIFAVNVALHVAGKLKLPVLYLDTEMDKTDHWPRILANISYEQDGVKSTISDIESGKFADLPSKKKNLLLAKQQLETMPFDYLNIFGKPFEETLSIMRRWIHKKVGIDDNGNTNPCLILYDYVKLMNSEPLKGNLAEFQALGFLMTSMHNFAARHDVPILAFIQLNRDGINKEDTDVISGSDRILWLTTNFAIFKTKTPEEIAQDGPDNGNRKLIVLKTRHGEGMTYGDYINMHMYGKYAKIIEGETRNNLKHLNPTSTKIKKNKKTKCDRQEK